MLLLVGISCLIAVAVRPSTGSTLLDVVQVATARVGDKVYSGNLREYYYAVAGSRDALGTELEARRIGGAGRYHVFHFPEGVPNSKSMPVNADRRKSISSLVQLTAGTVVDTSSFPAYVLPATYQDPISAKGKNAEKIASQSITKKSVMGELKQLTELPNKKNPTRASANPAATKQAETHLLKKFSDMGYQTCLHKFVDKGDLKLANVVAYKKGTTDDAVTVGAHYDSRQQNMNKGKAPGADDNGSGVAALLAIAKAFSHPDVKTQKSVYFVGFAGEEIGLEGSNQFAHELFSAGLPAECNNLAGSANSSFMQGGKRVMRGGRVMKAQDSTTHRAIILDEVGWRSPKFAEPTLNLETKESDDGVDDVQANVAAGSAALNGDKLKLTLSLNPFGSDHMSFLDRGVKAALMINADDDQYPDYHKDTDTIDKVNGEYIAMIAKASFGGLMRLARA